MITIEPADSSDAKEMLAIYRYYVTDTTVSSEYEPPSLKRCFKNGSKPILQSFHG